MELYVLISTASIYDSDCRVFSDERTKKVKKSEREREEFSVLKQETVGSALEKDRVNSTLLEEKEREIS